MDWISELNSALDANDVPRVRELLSTYESVTLMLKPQMSEEMIITILQFITICNTDLEYYLNSNQERLFRISLQHGRFEIQNYNCIIKLIKFHYSDLLELVFQRSEFNDSLNTETFYYTILSDNERIFHLVLNKLKSLSKATNVIGQALAIYSNLNIKYIKILITDPDFKDQIIKSLIPAIDTRNLEIVQLFVNYPGMDFTNPILLKFTICRREPKIFRLIAKHVKYDPVEIFRFLKSESFPDNMIQEILTIPEFFNLALEDSTYDKYTIPMIKKLLKDEMPPTPQEVFKERWSMYLDSEPQSLQYLTFQALLRN